MPNGKGNTDSLIPVRFDLLAWALVHADLASAYFFGVPKLPLPAGL